MTIQNCTPHTINIFSDGKEVLVLAPSGVCPRCSQSETVVDVLDGIHITKQSFGAVEGLPPEQDGVFLVVSRMVASAASDRKDLLCPGPLVRGEDGQPRGCNGLSRV